MNKNNGDKIRLVSFLKIEPGKLGSIVKRLKELPNITKILSITGEYDILIEIEAETSEMLYDLFTNEIDPIEGIITIHSHYIMRRWDKTGGV